MAVRELSVKELGIVAGGLSYLDTVTVTGTVPDEPWVPWDEKNYFPDEFNAWDVVDEGGGTDGSQGAEINFQLIEEYLIDQLANNLAAQIMAKPDWQTREYVAVLYKMPDGTIVSTQVFAGLTNGTANQATIDAINAAGGVANLANIIGIIHNHPQSLVDNAWNTDTSAQIEKMPSDNDWATVEYLFENRTDFALYILGPDGELREYENSDRALWDARNEPSYYNNHEGQYDAWLDSDQGVKP